MFCYYTQHFPLLALAEEVSLLTLQSCIPPTACDVELLVDPTSPLHALWGQLLSSFIALGSLLSLTLSYFSGTGPLE